MCRVAPQLEIQIIVVIVAVVCALLGTSLVLRKMLMMSDSITHTILLGIVLAFFITHDLSSPFLILGVALIGVVTIWLTELLSHTRLLAEDAATGVVFPSLFSIAIVLITRYAGSVHLDTGPVLLGELAFVLFDHMVVGGVDAGTKATYITGVLLLINLAAITLFFKELKLVTFDSMPATVVGFSPALVRYGPMTLVSLITVGAFQAVNSALVVTLMIGPSVTTYLLTNDLKRMLLFSGAIGAVNGVLGYQLAALLNASITGSMAVVTGLVFLLVFILALHRGPTSVLRRRSNQKVELAKATLLFHLSNHENSEEETAEAGVDTIQVHLRWTPKFTVRIMRLLEREGNIRPPDGLVRLMDEGRQTSIHNYNILFFR